MVFNFDYLKKFDFVSVLRFSTVELLKQKNFFKEVGFLTGILVLLFLLLGLCAFGLISSAYLFITPELSIFTFLPIIFSLVFFGLFILNSVYFYYRMISFALSCAKKKFEKFSFNLAIKLILSGIFSFIVSFFCLYELKFLLVGIIGFVLFLVSVAFFVLSNSNPLFLIIGFLVMFISFILLFIYYIIVVRNSIRNSFYALAIVEKNKGVRDSVKYSWGVTGGKAVLIFFIQLILGGVLWILQQIFFLPLNFVSFPLEFASQIESFWILLIPLFIIFIILFIILMVVSELVIVFGMVKIYAQITQTSSKALNKRK